MYIPISGEGLYKVLSQSVTNSRLMGIPIYLYMYINIYIYMYIYVYTSVYLYIHTSDSCVDMWDSAPDY